METKYIFRFVVLDEGTALTLGISDFVTPSWFAEVGKKNQKGEPVNPSKLVTIFKALYGFYYPDLNVFNMSTPSIGMINDLIGKQVRIAVKVKGEGDEARNKITDYTVIKKELEVPEGVSVATVAAARKSMPVTDVTDDADADKGTGFIEGLEADKKVEEEKAKA